MLSCLCPRLLPVKHVSVPSGLGTSSGSQLSEQINSKQKPNHQRQEEQTGRQYDEVGQVKVCDVGMMGRMPFILQVNLMGWDVLDHVG